MSKFKKIIKWVSITIITTILTWSFYLQIKFERYIQKQKKEYSILLNRKRISYQPAVVYLFNDRKKLMGAGQLVYQESKNSTIFSGRLYDGYIIKCYFSKEEIELFWEIKLSHGVL